MTKHDWKAAIWAGIIAGAVFMMLEMIMVSLWAGSLGTSPYTSLSSV